MILFLRIALRRISRWRLPPPLFELFPPKEILPGGPTSPPLHKENPPNVSSLYRFIHRVIPPRCVLPRKNPFSKDYPLQATRSISITVCKAIERKHGLLQGFLNCFCFPASRVIDFYPFKIHGTFTNLIRNSEFLKNYTLIRKKIRKQNVFLPQFHV